ncbi:MAG: outer membrane beta-barrel protein [Hyphomonadaceae bacterium]|jgi:outer membrane immunogenic protein|nr:outer membrane beta-barrel protein [Hyphomonadaceae bacterium]
MRRFAMAALAAFLALSAHAEGINRSPRVTAPAQADEGPAWNRSGLYVAAIGGYNTAVLQTEGVDLSNGKLMGGGAIGYNHRMGQWVVGVEGDWLFTDISASTTVSGTIVSASNRHLASVRARGGIAAGPALLYATVGPAWQSARVSVASGSATDSVWQLGWVAGGGIEMELTRSFAVRLEALHYRFGEDGSPFDAFETRQTVARAGLVFKF